MTPADRSSAEVLAALIDALGSLDPISAGALFADDSTFEFPYGPPGMPQQVSGIKAVRRVLRGMSMFESIELYDRDVRSTDDPELAFATFRSAATMGGRPYANRYICRARVRDGQIIEYQEHFGPLPFIASMRAWPRITTLIICALPPRAAAYVLDRTTKKRQRR